MHWTRERLSEWNAKGILLLLVAERLAALTFNQQTEELWRQPIEEKGLTLEVDVGEALSEVWGDRERIAQVLANLLGNAC